MKKMKVLSLFAGIGGIDLGLERTGRFETVAFVENDKNCHLVLKNHWPNVPIFKDVRAVSHCHIYAGECYLQEHHKEGSIETEIFCGGKIDVIVGGFPCQDISKGGNGEGLVKGKRSSLWKEYARLIKEVRPKYAIIENVDELANNGLGVVLRDLSRIGYDAEWHTLTATGVCNLPHQRKRLFVIAYARSQRCDECSGQDSDVQAHQEWSSENLSQIWSQCQSEPIQVRQILSRRAVDSYRASHAGRQSTFTGIRRVTDGIPQGLDESLRKARIKQLGNSVCPDILEMIGLAIAEREDEKERNNVV
jgi:DNA (cytosine-5)-methyltransferase 1